VIKIAAVHAPNLQITQVSKLFIRPGVNTIRRLNTLFLDLPVELP
jgi:hypothetical protein